MAATTPLAFRPSPAQRAIALLLCAGSWLVGVQGLARLLQNTPRLLDALRATEASGEPTLALWTALIAGLAAVVAGGLLLLLAALGLLLIEGTQVLVDDLGLAVELTALPGPLARRLGAGRLTWKQVTGVQKGRFFFQIHGGGGQEAPSPEAPPVLRFLVVDELERLLLIVLERSPNLKL